MTSGRLTVIELSVDGCVAPTDTSELCHQLPALRMGYSEGMKCFSMLRADETTVRLAPLRTSGPTLPPPATLRTGLEKAC